MVPSTDLYRFRGEREGKDGVGREEREGLFEELGGVGTDGEGF